MSLEMFLFEFLWKGMSETWIYFALANILFSHRINPIPNIHRISIQVGQSGKIFFHSNIPRTPRIHKQKIKSIRIMPLYQCNISRCVLVILFSLFIIDFIDTQSIQWEYSEKICFYGFICRLSKKSPPSPCFASGTQLL